MASQAASTAPVDGDGDFWLFGYGSLIWKPPPHFDQRIPGYIEGYVRRFWQASEDHRGTPEAPGRVVTLIDRAHWETLTDHHESTEQVWGAAYHIPADKVAEVRSYLDIREINGYSIQYTPFHPAPFTTTITSPPLSPPRSPSAPEPTSTIISTTTITASPSLPSTPITCLVYIGLPSNPQFLGPQDPQHLAEHILRSRGPSGDNKEYLYLLERALGDLSQWSGDAHVSDLVARARAVERAGVEGDGEGAGAGADEVGDAKPRGEVLHKVGSTEEVEEVEK